MTHRAPATTPATEDGKPVAGKRGIRFAKESLWHVLKPMELGDGPTRLSLQNPQMVEVVVAGEGMRKAALVGDERGLEATALVPAGVAWVAGEEFEGGRQIWTVALFEAWEPGWSRLTLAAS